LTDTDSAVEQKHQKLRTHLVSTFIYCDQSSSLELFSMHRLILRNYNCAIQRVRKKNQLKTKITQEMSRV